MKKLILIIIILFSIKNIFAQKRILVENYGDTVFYKNEPKIIRLKITNLVNDTTYLEFGANGYASVKLNIKNQKLNIDTSLRCNYYIVGGHIDRRYLYNKGDTTVFNLYLEEYYTFLDTGIYTIGIQNFKHYLYRTGWDSEPYGYTLVIDTLTIQVKDDNRMLMEQKKKRYKQKLKYLKTGWDVQYYYMYLFEARSKTQDKRYKRIEPPAPLEPKDTTVIRIKDQKVIDSRTRYYYALDYTSENILDFDSFTIIKQDTYYRHTNVPCTFVLTNTSSDTKFLHLGRYNIEKLYFKIITPDSKIIEIYPTGKMCYILNPKTNYKIRNVNYYTTGQYRFKPYETKKIYIDFYSLCDFNKLGKYKIYMELKVNKNNYPKYQLYYLAGFKKMIEIEIKKYNSWDE